MLLKTKNMGYLIAIASSDGQVVDQHFAKAQNFLIYEITEGEVAFVEDREGTIGLNDGVHSDVRLEEIRNLLNDCRVVFVLKIGDRAVRYLNANGIKSFAVDFSLNN